MLLGAAVPQQQRDRQRSDARSSATQNEIQCERLSKAREPETLRINKIRKRKKTIEYCERAKTSSSISLIKQLYQTAARESTPQEFRTENFLHFAIHFVTPFPQMNVRCLVS